MGEKVTFDGVNKIIQITSAPVLVDGDWVVDIDFKEHIYSDGKVDWLGDQDLRRRYFPVRPVGGDALPGSKALGSTFFLAADWKIRPYEADHVFNLNGNVYSEDGTSPFTSVVGTYNVMIINTVSSLVDSTVQQLQELQYTSYQNAVWVDLNSSNTGSSYPTGTREYPVNNFADAVTICNERGFAQIGLLSNATLDGNINIEGMTMFGVSPTSTSLVILASALTQKSIFRDLTISGALDGGSEIHDCTIGELDYFNGAIHHSMLNGPITLGGGAVAHIHGCYSGVPGQTTPTIDMGGSGQSLALRNYNGGIKLINKTGVDDAVSIDLNSGQIILDATVAAGTVVCRGIGKITDNSIGATVYSEDLLNRGSVANSVWNTDVGNHLESGSTGFVIGIGEFNGQVQIDTINGTSGTDFPQGTAEAPVNNLTDALTIATLRGINTLYFTSDYTFINTVNIADYLFKGEGLQDTILTFESGCIVANCHVEHAVVTGWTTGITKYTDTLLKDFGSVGLAPSSINLLIEDCAFDGTITLPDNYSGSVKILDCWANIVGDISPIFDLGNSTANVIIHDWSGGIKIINATQNNIISILMNAGRVEIDSSVTAAFVNIGGVGAIIDNHTGTATVNHVNLVKGQELNDVYELSLINKALSFNEYVTIDVNGEAGTEYPIGTHNHPVNNLTDAKIIAGINGIEALLMHSNFTIGVAEDISSLTLMSHDSPILTLTPGCITNNTIFKHLEVTGQFNGYVTLDKCVTSANGITNFYGIMRDCGFNDGITISSDNTKNAVFVNCYTADVPGPPIFNCGGDGAKISFRGLTGVFLFTNKTGSTKPIFLDINSGRVGFDSTVTAGSITIRGIGYVYQDDSTNTTFDTDGFISKSNISLAVWDELGADHSVYGTMGRFVNDLIYIDKSVYVDTELVQNGDGGSEFPFNNFPDAVDFLEERGWRYIKLLSDATIDRTLKNFVIEGVGALPTVDFNGQNVDKSEFIKVKLTGTQVGSVTCREVVLLNLQGVNGIYKDSGVLGNISLAENSNTTIASASTLLTSTTVSNTIDAGISNVNTVLNIRKFSGTIKLINMNHANKLATCEFAGGRLELDSTNTLGTIGVAGLPDTAFFDNSNGSTILNFGLFPGAQAITDTLLDEPIDDHITAGSVGHYMRKKLLSLANFIGLK